MRSWEDPYIMAHSAIRPEFSCQSVWRLLRLTVRTVIFLSTRLRDIPIYIGDYQRLWSLWSHFLFVLACPRLEHLIKSWLRFSGRSCEIGSCTRRGLYKLDFQRRRKVFSCAVTPAANRSSPRWFRDDCRRNSTIINPQPIFFFRAFPGMHTHHRNRLISCGSDDMVDVRVQKGN